MLLVEGLHVYYGQIAALRDVSLRVDEGELVGVIGPNGAGKSTLLLAVAGGIRPTAGKITFNGHSVVGMAPDAIVKRGISLVPEGRRIFGTLTVAENLKVASSTRHGREEISRDVEHVLELFPILSTYLRKPAGELSGGEQQQLAIARALIAKPKLLLVDEPSLGLAPILVDRVFEVLEELHKQGMTILVVEQNAVRAHALTDRLYVLRTGRIELLDKDPRLIHAIESGELYFGRTDNGGPNP
ncbi:MAG TPA: ABC transporter ATP-binding protein [Gaiellaceae bacterium]|nr:ABC transporter ATP-binding protein [Gaiellaceae bacterium]